MVKVLLKNELYFFSYFHGFIGVLLDVAKLIRDERKLFLKPNLDIIWVQFSLANFKISRRSHLMICRKYFCFIRVDCIRC